MQKILLCGLFAFALFLGVLGGLRLGWRIGRKRLTAEGEGGHAGLAAVEGAIFGLVGLLIAFTFTGAASRFDQRRQLITQQVNALGTAWLRLDLVGGSGGDELRDLLRRYVDAEVEVWRNLDDGARQEAALKRVDSLQNKLWTKAVAVTKADKTQPLTLAILPPLNEVFDLATSRALATRQHPPLAIYLMLTLLVLVGSLLAGFGMAKASTQSRLHVYGFAAVLAVSIYLILDMELPRFGLIRVDDFDRALIELRATMR